MAFSLTTAVAAGAIATASPSAAKSGFRSEVSALRTARYGTVLVVGDGRLRGFPLYAFSGDADGELRCGTTLAWGYDLGPTLRAPLTCTGPESDLINAVKTDDWPALTTTGAPIAGPGVSPKLLGTIQRTDIGEQVTYAGHPLYLFDPASRPFEPQGEGYMETVHPLAPWHGYWFLVSAKSGDPAPGATTLEPGTLPDGKKVLAVEVDENVSPVAATVYAFSRDHPDASTCVNACAATWVPVLSNGPPRVEGGVSNRAIGLIRRSNGAEQVTYDGAPLYLYAKEKVFLTPEHALKGSGTAGSGEGLKGPDGGTFSWIALSPRG